MITANPSSILEKNLNPSKYQIIVAEHCWLQFPDCCTWCRLMATIDSGGGRFCSFQSNSFIIVRYSWNSWLHRKLLHILNLHSAPPGIHHATCRPFCLKKNAGTLFWCHQLRCWSRGLQLIPWILSLKSSTIAVCKKTQLYLFPKSVRKMFQSSTYLLSLHSGSLHVVAMIFYYCIWWMENYLFFRNWSLKNNWKEKTWGETNYCNLYDVVKESHVYL